jgi:dienelactone hydrolase
LLLTLLLFVWQRGYAQQGSPLPPAQEKKEATTRFDDTSVTHWPNDFKRVDIPSSVDGSIQPAYFFTAKGTEPRPLVVSLHTWSGSFEQKDDISLICRDKNIHYIHPDFRGPNRTPSACCSDLAMKDIDDAIRFAIANAAVDISEIYVVGVSGGGYATLSTFMKSSHPIKKFSAWASISDLTAWHRESQIRKNRYEQDILACTGSVEHLDSAKAQARSPLFWPTPVTKLDQATLTIYAGVYDGIQGSVPFTHSINFYNKVVKDLGITDPSSYISMEEKLDLMEKTRPLGDFGSISGRSVFLSKQVGNLRIVLFEGNHEMLTDFALGELLDHKKD